MDVKLLKFKKIGQSSIGYLSFFESNQDIPFDIKRIYYTYSVPEGVQRGMHAHKELQQVLWCPYGAIEVLLDDGRERTSYLLNSPDIALLVMPGYWRDMYWQKEGSVLCVAASEYYYEEDYIRDYDKFIEYVEKGYWDNAG